MAKDVVIVNLKVNEKGAVQGVDKASQSLDRLGNKAAQLSRKVEEPSRKMGQLANKTKQLGNETKKATSTAAVFTAKLFDMKGALIAVGGAIGVTFILLQIGMVLRDLAIKVLDNIEAWGTFKTSLDDTFRSMALGETAAENLARKLEELATAAGVQIFGDAFSGKVQKGVALIEGLLIRQKQLQSEIQAAESPFFFQMGSATSTLTGKKIPLTPIDGDSAALALKLIEEGLDKAVRAMFDLQEQTGLTVTEFDERFGTELSDAVVKATRLVEGFNGELRETGEIIKQAERLPEIFDGLDLRDFTEMGPTIWEPVVEYGNAWADVGVILEEDIIPTLERLATSYEKVGVVANAASSLISAAASTGVISQKEAARLIMAIMAVRATQSALFELAAGVAAAARYDFGAAVLHNVAAGLYFASAAVSGIGAIAGPGGGGGGVGFAVGTEGGDQGGQRDQHITIIVQGPISGETRYEVGQEIVDLVNESQSDGMVVSRT